MIEWLEKHQLPCIYKHFLGFECPTCGFQRALIYLLKGDLISSLQTYPALIPTLFLFILLFSYLLIKKPNWQFVKRFVVFDLALIVISYTIRIIK
jgi:hypothetical protein